MSGFENETVYGKNADFTSVNNQNVQESNGLFTDGQLWIGRTSVNAGGTHIDVNTLTAGTGISITNGPGTITIANTGPTTDLYTASYIVDGAVPAGANFSTIQDAIDQAILDGATTSSPGTLICVRPGTYAGFTTSGANFITITSLASAFQSNQPVIVNSAITIAVGTNAIIQNISCSDTLTNTGTSCKIEGCNIFTLANNVGGLYLNSCVMSTFTTGPAGNFVAYNSEALSCTIDAVTVFSLIGCNFTNTTIHVSSTGTCYFSRVETSSLNRLNGCWATGRNTYNSNTGTGDSGFVPMVQSASSSDPFINWRVIGVTDWIAGIDNSDTDAWVLARGTALGTTNALKFDTSGNLYLPGQTGIIGANGASAATASPVTNHATLVGATSNGITSLALGTAGQVLTSNGAGADPSYKNPTGAVWTEVTGTSQAAAVNNGYIANNAGLVTVTLPATFAVGDVVWVVGKGAGLWALAANTGDTIHLGNQDTSAGGSLTATNRYDAVQVVGTVANAEWTCTGVVIGNLTIA